MRPPPRERRPLDKGAELTTQQAAQAETRVTLPLGFVAHYVLDRAKVAARRKPVRPPAARRTGGGRR